MKLVYALPLSLAVLAACAPLPPETYSFVDKAEGISGDYSASVYSSAHIKASVGELACVSGRLKSYTETPGGDRVKFTAQCDGPRKETAVTAYTMNEAANVGHLTTQRDGKLLREDLSKP